MLLFLQVSPDRQKVRVRFPPDPKQTKVMTAFSTYVVPGEDWQGYGFDELAALGSGKYEMPMPRPEGPSQVKRLPTG